MNQVIKKGSVMLAPNAVVVGDVVLENNVSVWYGAVIRGDCGRIQIGENTNVQDNCVLHDPITIGKGCTIGHGALVHGCEIGDHTMIGMGAIVLSGAKIGSHCVVAAGAVVKENMVIPDGHLVMGVPARIVGPTRQELIDEIYKNELEYLHLSTKAFGK